MSNNTTQGTKGRKRGFIVQYAGPRGGLHTKRGDALEIHGIETLYIHSRGRWYGVGCHTVESISDAAGVEIYRKTAGARLPAVVLISTALREYKARRGA